MLRAVLGVALAAALVAAVTPALEDARATRTERLAARELGRVESAASALVREEAPGARRTLALSLPGESPTAAPLAFVALGGLPDGVASDERTVTDSATSDVLAYRVAGGPVTVRRLGVDLRVVRGGDRIRSDSRALVFRRGGSYRVTLRLVRVRGRSVVVVSAPKASVDVGIDNSRLGSSRSTRFGPVDFEGPVELRGLLRSARASSARHSAPRLASGATARNACEGRVAQVGAKRRLSNAGGWGGRGCGAVRLLKGFGSS